MTEFKQSASLAERARAYLEDVRMGHVSFTDESAPFMTLTGYLADLLAVIDGTGEARAHQPAAGQLPCCGRLDQLVACQAGQLRMVLRCLLGQTAAQLAAAGEVERDTLRQAFTDAMSVRAAAAAEPCPECAVSPALLCPRHSAELDWVSAYRMLACDLGLYLGQR
jgi:hypothetical protein